MVERLRIALSRRSFLGASAAALAASALPSRAVAQGAKYRRFEISDPNMPPRILDSYKAAVRAMLALPPTDPRNWYRNAFVHIFDCPHSNWWFLAWHRAYLGWFERICRELSGDHDFALPYWDWTKTPRVPAAMFSDVLDPNDTAFTATFDQFKSRFENPVSTLWTNFSQPQKQVLAQRGLNSPDDFWNAVPGMFFAQPNARDLAAANPDLDPVTKVAVSIVTIRSSLRVPVFAEDPSGNAPPGFASDKVQNHNGASREGILESQPHDNVHGAVGGFMSAFLSPVDPIFFLHHGNLDRLWDVWTRRQTALHRPTLPEGADRATWEDEQFLFFSDENGQPVSKIKAGDYALMSTFDYDYSPGSGEDQVPAAVAAAPQAVRPAQRFSARISSEAIGAGQPASGVAEVPGTLLQAPAPEAPAPTVEVTLNLTPADQGSRFRVLLSAAGGANQVDAGAITVFGHHAGTGPTTFSVPVPENLGATGQNVALNIRVEPLEPAGPARPRAAGHTGAAPMSTGPTVSAAPRVTAIHVGTF